LGQDAGACLHSENAKVSPTQVSPIEVEKGSLTSREESIMEETTMVTYFEQPNVKNVSLTDIENSTNINPIKSALEMVEK
ncbi:hypothetical protein KI387_028022, partial [Taxus chinensis]